jgi:hypothetical protein
MADSDSRRKPIKVILPPEPPELTPAAARALLKVLVKAYERQQAGEAAKEPAASETGDD